MYIIHIVQGIYLYFDLKCLVSPDIADPDLIPVSRYLWIRGGGAALVSLKLSFDGARVDSIQLFKELFSQPKLDIFRGPWTPHGKIGFILPCKKKSKNLLFLLLHIFRLSFLYSYFLF